MFNDEIVKTRRLARFSFAILQRYGNLAIKPRYLGRCEAELEQRYVFHCFFYISLSISSLRSNAYRRLPLLTVPSAMLVAENK